MEFIREGLNLPVPFNILPMPALILCLFKKIFLCCFSKALKKSVPDQVELPVRKENGTASSSHNAPKDRQKVNGHVSPQKNKASTVGGTRSSFGSNELSYRKVMGRVVKRFLLHNNRENEEIHESRVDELKQDVQMIRFEILDNIRHNRDDMIRNMNLMHGSVNVLGDLIFSKTVNQDLNGLFRDFQNYDGDEEI